MVLDHPGIVSRASTDEGLYYPVDKAGKPEQKQATIRLIPYYAWANRGTAAMQVWIPCTQA
jgi:DUF1680 family protein